MQLSIKPSYTDSPPWNCEWVMFWWVCTQILQWKTVLKIWESCGFNYCTAGTLHLHTAYPIWHPHYMYVKHSCVRHSDTSQCLRETAVSVQKHVAKSRGGAVLSCHGCQTLLLTYSWCGCGLSDGVCVCVCLRVRVWMCVFQSRSWKASWHDCSASRASTCRCSRMEPSTAARTRTVTTVSGALWKTRLPALNI